MCTPMFMSRCMLRSMHMLMSRPTHILMSRTMLMSRLVQPSCNEYDNVKHNKLMVDRASS